MTQKDFLTKQLDMLKDKYTGGDTEWSEICTLRSAFYNNGENPDTVRKGGKLIGEYLSSGWTIAPAEDATECAASNFNAELQKLRDQRRELVNLQRSGARFDHLTSVLQDSVRRIADKALLRRLPSDYIAQLNGTEAVVVFADWHYGMVTDNIWNTYNTEICAHRVAEFLEKTRSALRLHRASKVHIVVLGDCAHGAIHTSARVASEEAVCDQIMHVAELLSQAIECLANEFGETHVYCTYGNHLRTIQNKKDSIHSDNMEKLIPWWLEQRFYNRDDIVIEPSEHKEFILFSVMGSVLCATHGDLDSASTIGAMCNSVFSKKFGTQVDYVLMGDKHHMENYERYGVETILARALCGTDNYANDKRLYSSAGQTLLIFDGHGKLCQYDFKVGE